jgi:hypothetical protein
MEQLQPELEKLEEGKVLERLNVLLLKPAD